MDIKDILERKPTLSKQNAEFPQSTHERLPTLPPISLIYSISALPDQTQPFLQPHHTTSQYGHPVHSHYELASTGHHAQFQPSMTSSLTGNRPLSHLGSHEGSPKKIGKWTPGEDRLAIELRRKGMKWDDISKKLPGRSAISCRLRCQNYADPRPKSEWNEDKKNELARLYKR
jgi:hypothetical protein